MADNVLIIINDNLKIPMGEMNGKNTSRTKPAMLKILHSITHVRTSVNQSESSSQ